MFNISTNFIPNTIKSGQKVIIFNQKINPFSFSIIPFTYALILGRTLPNDLTL